MAGTFVVVAVDVAVAVAAKMSLVAGVGVLLRT